MTEWAATSIVLRRFVALATLMLGLGLMSGCTTPAPEPDPPPPPPPNYGPTDFDPIGFESGSVSLSPEAANAVRSMAMRMKRADVVNDTIVVAGHTDSVGASERNREVSMRRAEAVLEVLTESGIDRNRVRLVAHGEDRPLLEERNSDGTRNPEAFVVNRRVEVRLESGG
ncbi:MAG: OmpA family protein [Gammaproteobacteria bacterium]